MSKAHSITLPQLDWKLGLLFAHARTLRRAVDLARRMGVKPSTVSGWINGTKGKDRGRVPSTVLDRLCKLLAAELPGNISEGEARVLWLAPYPEFKETLLRLIRGAAVDLLSVLSRSDAHLPVRQVIFDPSALGMIDDVVAVPEHATRISGKCEIAFEVDGVVGCKLIVLAEEREGWRILAPGLRHNGLIERIPERVPGIPPRMLRFKPPFGQYRFVFLEIVTDIEASLPPAGGVSALPISAFDELGKQLLAARLPGMWRWEEAFFDVVS